MDRKGYKYWISVSETIIGIFCAVIVLWLYFDWVLVSEEACALMKVPDCGMGHALLLAALLPISVVYISIGITSFFANRFIFIIAQSLILLLSLSYIFYGFYF